MYTFLRIIVICILSVNAMGALYGGLSLMLDPSGALLQMPLDFLEHSPFSSYLVPGIVLFVVNGLFSLLTLFMVLRKHPQCQRFIMAQGVLLAGWIAVQVAMLQIFYAPLHLPFFLMGAFLLFSGVIMAKQKRTNPAGEI